MGDLRIDRRCGCNQILALGEMLLVPLLIMIVLWTLNYLAAPRPVALFELIVLLLAYAVAGEVVAKMWMRLEWPLTWEIIIYGAMSAAAAAAVFFIIFPRAASWYELGVVATFFVHGASAASLLHCLFDECLQDAVYYPKPS